jgi:hypothetical protein
VWWRLRRRRRIFRGPTIIALRARRTSLHIAQQIAYPRVYTPPTWTLPRRGTQWWDDPRFWFKPPERREPMPEREQWRLILALTIVFTLCFLLIFYSI